MRFWRQIQIRNKFPEFFPKKTRKMRIWCVPSATELESPKLPPRIDRDVYLRSPPPPPRLTKEEKLARGVIVLKSHSSKSRKSARIRKSVRKSSSSSSSGTGTWPEPLPFATISSRRSENVPPPPPPRFSPGSSGNSLSGSSPTGTSVSGNLVISGSVIGTNEGLLKSTSQHKSSSASLLSTTRSKKAPAYRSSPKKASSTLSSSRISINTFSCSTPFGSLLTRDDDFLARFQNGAASPISIRHPGTSKSREKKTKKRTNGKNELDPEQPEEAWLFNQVQSLVN